MSLLSLQGFRINITLGGGTVQTVLMSQETSQHDLETLKSDICVSLLNKIPR